jgi:hypothetical protein
MGQHFRTSYGPENGCKSTNKNENVKSNDEKDCLLRYFCNKINLCVTKE